MGIGLASMVSDELGTTTSGSKGLGDAEDFFNTYLASQIPFLGAFFKKTNKKFESEALKGSSTYAWKSTADGLYNGKFAAGGSKADKITKHNNMLLATADNILTNEKLNLIGANDPRYY